MPDFIKKNFISFLLSALFIMLIFNVLLANYNRNKMEKNQALRLQIDIVKDVFGQVFGNTLRRIDLGLRGYALTRNEQLLSPYWEALQNYKVNVNQIDSLLQAQGLDTLRTQFSRFSGMLDQYMVHVEKMRTYVADDNMEEFVKLLNMDKGYELWINFEPIQTKLFAYEDGLLAKAQNDYEQALNGNVIFQFGLVILGFPILLTIVFRLKREERDRNTLLNDFKLSNLRYVFNPGDDQQEQSTNVIEQSIENLKQASHFIKGVTQGNYEVQWNGLTPENYSLNDGNLVGNLVKMRDEMNRVKQEDKKRLWMTDGLAKFSEVVRNNQNSISTLTEAVVKFLTKYLNAQQGSLFLLVEEENRNSKLVLTACYAFDKKKYLNKEIAPGDGLVGQAYLEGEIVFLTRLPKGYITITSGLGDATPSSLIIVPMKYNQKVEAIFEVASFHKFEDYQVQFLERAGEFVASAIHYVRTNEQTAVLLKQSQEQTEMLRTRDEQMRQNMEELHATQEEMGRKEKEMERLIRETQNHESQLKIEVEKMKQEMEEQSRETIETIEKNKRDLMEILNKLPQKIFLKDAKGNMLLCNEEVARIYKLPIEKIIGTNDFDHFDHGLAQAYFDKEQSIMKNGAETYVQDEILTGERRLLKTTKMPFYIRHKDETGLLGIQYDITEQSQAQEKEKLLIAQLNDLRESIDRIKKTNLTT